MPARSPTYISTITATKIAATRLNEITTMTMAKTAAIASALSSNSPNCACSDIFEATRMPASKMFAGEAEPPLAPIWNRLSTTALAKPGPWSRMKANRPMNMMRRTSSANQASSEAACSASHTAAMPTSMLARIQNSERAASITVVSQPLAAVETWFSNVVSTLPCCASAGALASRITAMTMKVTSNVLEGWTATIGVSSPARRERSGRDRRRRNSPCVAGDRGTPSAPVPA